MYGSYAQKSSMREKENTVKTKLSINLTQLAYITSITSQFNIIATQHVDHPSNTGKMKNIEPHNLFKG